MVYCNEIGRERTIMIKPEICIYDNKVRYNTKMEGCTNLSSDITELSEIVNETNKMRGKWI